MPFSQGGGRPQATAMWQSAGLCKLPLQHNISHQGQRVAQVDKGMEGSKQGGVSQWITKVSCKFAHTPGFCVFGSWKLLVARTGSTDPVTFDLYPQVKYSTSHVSHDGLSVCFCIQTKQSTKNRQLLKNFCDPLMEKVSKDALILSSFLSISQPLCINKSQMEQLWEITAFINGFSFTDMNEWRQKVKIP